MTNTITLSTKQTYGSLTNRIQELHCLFPADFDMQVGFGGTEYMWSDCKPYSVCSVNKNWNNKGYEILGVQQDYHAPNKDRTDYVYTPNINASVNYLKSERVETKGGFKKRYRPVHWNKKTNRWNNGGVKITLGHKEYYRDPSF